MIVIKKILSYEYNLDGVCKMCRIQDSMTSCEIYTVYEYVVDFIMWYMVNQKTPYKNIFINDMEKYKASLECKYCGERDTLIYHRSVSNGEVWCCKVCKDEILTPHCPNEDEY